MAEDLPEDAVFIRPLTVRIREACRLTGIGRSKLYELIAAGEIEVVKVGAITLVPVSSLTSFLRRKAANL
jgi:excisionase family DNA binding protein